MDRIVVEHQPDDRRLAGLNLPAWRQWTKEPDEFTRHYGSDEMCYFLEGSAFISSGTCSQLAVGKGDLLFVPAGTSCSWIIHEGIKALYQPCPLYNLLI